MVAIKYPLTTREVVRLLKAEGLQVEPWRVLRVISNGQLPRPRMSDSLIYFFDESDVEAMRAYFLANPLRWKRTPRHAAA